MGKRILLIGGNFMPEPTGIGKYNGEMIQWFARNGYECTVISTSPYYPYWKVQQPYSGNWYKKELIETEGGQIEVYRCPHYIPSIPSGAKRLLSEISFSASSFVALLRLLARKKFHYVMTVAPPFELGFHALLYKVFRRAKLLYHIQDLQIEAARDLHMINSSGLIKFLLRIEKRILKSCDLVSSISQGMARKISAKVGQEVIFFPNWVDTGAYYPIRDKGGIKKSFGFSPEDKIVLYSGAIGEKQDLERILESAKRLRRRKEIKFLICGSGPYKEKLHGLAMDEGLANVRFLPLQSEETFNTFLNMADVHLVLQKANAGDLMMPSKLTTILAVGGLTIVTAKPETCLYQTVAENNIGILVEPEDSERFTAALLYCLKEDLSGIGENARRYAVESLSIDRVLTRYASQIEGLYRKEGAKKETKKGAKEQKKLVLHAVSATQIQQIRHS